MVGFHDRRHRLLRRAGPGGERAAGRAGGGFWTGRDSGRAGDRPPGGRHLLHLPTWADRRRTFERVAAALAPEGRFAWNAFAFDHHVAARLDDQHQDEPVPHTNRYSVGDNRIDVIRDDGVTTPLWWATTNEWLGLLDVAGLELEALHGGFAGEPFTDVSSEYVFVARRR